MQRVFSLYLYMRVITFSFFQGRGRAEGRGFMGLQLFYLLGLQKLQSYMTCSRG